MLKHLSSEERRTLANRGALKKSWQNSFVCIPL